MPPLHPTTVVAFAPLAVVAVGLGSLLRARRHITEQLLFAAEYRKHLHVLLEQRDGQAYEWLTVNANRMQSHMGSAGFLTMRPPHASYMVSNYAIVLNGLAEIRKYLSDSYLSGTDLPAQYGALIDDALLRHHGTLVERRRFNSGSLKNPFTWLAVGTQKLLQPRFGCWHRSVFCLAKSHREWRPRLRSACFLASPQQWGSSVLS